MSKILFVSMLFALPGSLIFLLGDDVAPLKALQIQAKSRLTTSRDRTDIHLRLEEIGKNSEHDYESFRLRQYGFSATFSILILVLLIFSGKSIFQSILFAGIVLAFIFISFDRNLSRRIRKHRETIESEFPAVIEMMTLAIAAGESPMQAILRIAESAEGELSKEFAIVIAEIRQGQPLHLTLDEMGRRVKSVMIRRFVDAVVTATLRGAPLIEVLSRHAIEARGNQRNRIMNAAGKAEIAMMIPVVFLILPISILFALWPSLTNLNLFAN